MSRTFFIFVSEIEDGKKRYCVGGRGRAGQLPASKTYPTAGLGVDVDRDYSVVYANSGELAGNQPLTGT